MRSEILRFVTSADEVSVLEVMAELSLTRNGVVTHLRALEAEALGSSRRGTHPRGSGAITYWRADIAEIEDMCDDLTRHLLMDA
jgi:predicted ArsR family transcriptional regulator